MPLVKPSRFFTALLTCQQVKHPVQVTMPFQQVIWGKVREVDVDEALIEDWAGAFWIVRLLEIQALTYGSPVIERYTEYEAEYLAAVQRRAASVGVAN